MKQKYSWSAVMRYCHFALHIPPQDFWGITMLEVLDLIEEIPESQSITKKDLEYLIKNFS
jgi:hypothetical protein